MTRRACALLFLAAAAALHLHAAAQAPQPPARPFPLSQVRLLDGPFKHAQDLNVAYLRALDPDRLLAPYRIEAGLQPRADKYPNWESSGLDGHTAGHYLTALAQAWAATGDAEMKRRLDYMVAELAECQRANGDGYVGGVPGGRRVWREVAQGRLQVDGFGVNGAWVPWYNLHKLFAGLRDAHAIGGSSPARDVLVRLAGWCERLVAPLSEAQVQDMLRAEHGGMNEVLADVAALTGDARYLALAQRFSHRALLDPLLRHEDRLDGLHANTQIPKAIGFARIADLGGDPAGRDAARFFWETVVGRRTVAFGGNSVREHFNAGGDFSAMLESREGPETCNTYNMLRLTMRLFEREPDARYADFYERALFNHILSSQHPAHGGFVYFTPIRPRHYRVYSQPSHCFWCCVGSGMESHGKHGQFIYAHAGSDLLVNLFIASTLDWPERGVRLRQETAFPDQPGTRLTFALTRPQHFTVRLRHPGWVARDAFGVRINGRPWRGESTPSSYLAIDREWRDGDRVELALPMRTAVEKLPDGSDYVALVHGPIVLAARTGTEGIDGLVAGDGRMAHVSPGPYLPLDGAPMLVGDPESLAAGVRPVAGRTLTFTARDLIRPASAADLELVPFFRVHDSRYMVYWRTVAPAEYEDTVARLAADERVRLALEARTLDRVVAGEQQPEVEHRVQVGDSRTGLMHGRPWRDAADWFSYELAAGAERGPLELRVTYFAGERGRRFDILVNDRVIAAVTLDGRERDRFVDVAYPIPADAVASAPAGRLTVKFAAQDGSRAGAVYEVRLVRPD
jgi:DUF1680 family protein